MKTVFFKVALLLAFMGVFASCTDAQPVSQSDSRFLGQFYYRFDDGGYIIWDFDGKSSVQQTNTSQESVRIFEFIFYEDEMKGRRNWDRCFFRHINVGPYIFTFNNDGTELQMGYSVGSGVAVWRTYTRRLEHGIVTRQEFQKIDERFNGTFHWQANGHYRYWEFDGTTGVRYTVYRPAWVSPPLIVSGEVILDSFAHSALRTTSISEFRIYESGIIRHRNWSDSSRYLWSDDPELFAIVGPVVYGPYRFYFNDGGTELRVGRIMGPGDIQWRTYIRR